MSIRPMLFVGCGGSGGATLQYVMDNLKTELKRAAEAMAANDGVRVELTARILPTAWQFVHVDVPATSDGAKPERPPVVAEQGGRYIGLAPEGLTWEQVARRTWNTGRAEHPELVSGWLRRPGPDDPPLKGGAGQERAIGRGVTLDALTKLRDSLLKSLGQLNTAEAMRELQNIAAIFGSTVNPSPAVFIVSSMSGGSGASMVLDVAQVLAKLNSTLPAATAMFLYTSEVFESLDEGNRRGVEANGLAALGELLATSLGANADEGQLLQQLGVNGPNSPQPFRRVFPIGNKHGQQGAMFGDGAQETIYRAVGRGLAGLVASPVALNDFVAYDMTNNNPQPTRLEWLGEGSANGNPVQWGTFGFARLSLGRDRYGEYVSQRIARMAVDRLVTGHVREESASGEVDLDLAVEDAHRRLIIRLGLPQGPTSVLSLLARTGDPGALRDAVRTNSRETYKRLVFDDGQLNAPLPGGRFLSAVQRIVMQRQPELSKAMQKQSYDLVRAWHEGFVADLLSELDKVIAASGLQTARQTVLRLKDDAGRWAQELRAEATRIAPGGVTAAPAPPQQLVSAISGQQVVAPDHPARRDLWGVFADSTTKNVAAAAAILLADVLTDFGPSFADPLASALADQYQRLNGERSRPARAAASADLRTTVYAEWPVPGKLVPERFRGANNEVVLMAAETFPVQFDAHVQSVAAVRTGGAATTATTDEVLTEVITDHWKGHNDETEASVIVVTKSTWVPEKLTVDPLDPTQVRGRSAGKYALRLSPGDVLGRARAWVWREEGEIGPFLRQGLRAYMDPSGKEFEARRLELTSKFEAAMTQALPLVLVNTSAFGEVHEAALAESFKFSGLPFESWGGVDDALREAVARRQSVSDTTDGNLKNALNHSSSISHIDIFCTYAPMSPLAFSSLLRPLNKAWSDAKAERNTGFFWTNRRARPLPGSLAMSGAERRASIAGYVVGKVTGRLKGTYETAPGARSRPIQVFSEASQEWLSFPNPLLTPFAKGYQIDELPALLESHLLAIA